MKNYRIATMTIAGSDSSGGAGIQADLKTFSAIGTFGMSALTAVTAQNTEGVFLVEELSAEMVGKQIEVVFDDILPNATKVGMVSSSAIIHRIADVIEKYEYKNVIIDPVMISKSGYSLLLPEAKEALIQRLLPLARIVTPNIPEAEEITGMRITTLEEMKQAGEKIRALGPQFVLMKGGHLNGAAIDVLISEGDIEVLHTERLDRKNTHGTGCTLSAAITSYIALGCDVPEAVHRAKHYITEAIRHSFDIGHGVGPVHHFYSFEEEKVK